MGTGARGPPPSQHSVPDALSYGAPPGPGHGHRPAPAPSGERRWSVVGLGGLVSDDDRDAGVNARPVLHPEPRTIVGSRRVLCATVVFRACASARAAGGEPCSRWTRHGKRRKDRRTKSTPSPGMGGRRFPPAWAHRCEWTDEPYDKVNN